MTGIKNPRLQSRPEDNASSSGECLSCHTNVGTSFSQTSHHPTLEISGLHQDIETAADKRNIGNRHAECVDCHDPHSGTLTIITGNSLCLDCHTQGSTSGFTTRSGGKNLHNGNTHSLQACNAANVLVNIG
jgi:predicted CXXCH cytochrome family protein